MYHLSDISSSIFSHETELSTPPMGFITDSRALILSQVAQVKPCDLFHIVHWLSKLYNTCLQALALPPSQQSSSKNELKNNSS